MPTTHRRSRPRIAVATVAACCLAAALAAPAAAERLSDSQAKALLVTIERELDGLQKKIFPQFRDTVIRDQYGEHTVDRTFDALEEIARSIAAEIVGGEPDPNDVTTLLDRANGLWQRIEEERWTEAPDGAHPWEELLRSLQRLADSFNTDLDADPRSWRVDRVTDAELKAMIADLEQRTRELNDRVTKTLELQRSMSSRDRAAIVEQLGKLNNAAASVADGSRRGADVEEQVERMVERTVQLGRVLEEQGFDSSVGGQWRHVAESVDQLVRVHHEGQEDGYGILSGD